MDSHLWNLSNSLALSSYYSLYVEVDPGEIKSCESFSDSIIYFMHLLPSSTIWKWNRSLSLTATCLYAQASRYAIHICGASLILLPLANGLSSSQTSLSLSHVMCRLKPRASRWHLSTHVYSHSIVVNSLLHNSSPNDRTSYNTIYSDDLSQW